MGFPIDMTWQNLEILQVKGTENLAPCFYRGDTLIFQAIGYVFQTAKLILVFQI
jgi:hypothetical protein